MWTRRFLRCTVAILNLNIWTTEFVQLNSGITIVVELKFGLPKSHFIQLCDSWLHLQLWQLKEHIKLKWDNAKHSLTLTRKSLFLCFSYSDISYTFFTLFQSKVVHINIMRKTIPFAKFQYHLLKVRNLPC